LIPASERYYRFAVSALFLAFAAQCFFLIYDKSPTTDEVSFHTVNGYAYLKTRDFRMSPATPPLVREWVAVPWLWMKPVLNLSGSSWREADSVPFAVEFFYGHNRERSDKLLRTARFFAWLLAAGMGWVVYRWARTIYGRTASLVALGLFAFSPTIVGHSALAAADVGPALFYLLAIYLLFENDRHDSSRFPWGAALALGCALASKYTAVLLLPVIGVLLWQKRGLRRATWTLAGMLAVAFLVTWATYFFEFKPLLEGVPRVPEKIEMIEGIASKLSGGSAAVSAAAVRMAQETPIPLSSWILGFGGIARSHRDTYLHYFGGVWTEEGIWNHYLISFLFKTTVAFLLFLVWRGLASFRKSGLKWGPENAYLLLPVAILFFVTLFDSTGVGMRYLIPAMPFLFVWISGLAVGATRRRKKILVVLVVLHAASSLSQFPNNIAFFNILAGGPQGGYRWLRGSDHDWGGEMKSLKRWVDKNNVQSIKTSLFGTRDESFYDLPSTQAQSVDFEVPSADWYAISVNYLDQFKWTRAVKPVARVGNAIFIYDMRNTQ